MLCPDVDGFKMKNMYPDDWLEKFMVPRPGAPFDNVDSASSQHSITVRSWNSLPMTYHLLLWWLLSDSWTFLCVRSLHLPPKTPMVRISLLTSRQSNVLDSFSVMKLLWLPVSLIHVRWPVSLVWGALMFWWGCYRRCAGWVGSLASFHYLFPFQPTLLHTSGQSCAHRLLSCACLDIFTDYFAFALLR